MSWIKVAHELPDKPEVFRMAQALGIDPDAVVGKLIRFWSWCDQQSVSGASLGITQPFIDRLTHQPGFSDALIEVDWLRVRSGSLEVPRFDRHNGQTAKARAESARRMAKSRGNDTGANSCAESSENVAEKSQQKPQPEKSKRRVRENTNTPPIPPEGGGACDSPDSREGQPEPPDDPDPERPRNREQWAIAIYAAYPRKTGRDAALKAIASAIKRTGADPEHVLDRVRVFAGLYRNAPEDRQRFAKHPATFFNQGCWDDDDDVWRSMFAPHHNGHHGPVQGELIPASRRGKV